MTSPSPPTKMPPFDLACDEEHLDFYEEDEPEPQIRTFSLLKWEDGGGEDEKAELAALRSKEAAAAHYHVIPRANAVNWLISSSLRLGFSPQTALLAVNYLDRFLSVVSFQQPWMTQLSAVASLSLAAKMEEIAVPPLLDLQVEEARFVFEAKTVQRMELLVLSTLGWRLGSPTPLSFIDHFLRRLAGDGGGALFWKLQSFSHSTLLDLAADHRWVEFLPSELAAATMARAAYQILDRSLAAESLKKCVMDLAGVNKERFEACWAFTAGGAGEDERKRRRRTQSPGSPRGVADVSFSEEYSVSTSRPGSVSSSPAAPPPPLKRMRALGGGGILGVSNEDSFL